MVILDAETPCILALLDVDGRIAQIDLVLACTDVLLHAEHFAQSIDDCGCLVECCQCVVSQTVDAEEEVVDDGENSKTVAEIELLALIPLWQEHAKDANHTDVLKE